MCENSQQAFAILARLARGPQGGAEQAFVSGNSTFNLPAIVIQMLMKALLHLSSVFGRRPLAATASDVERDHCGADTESFSTKTVIVFSVVGGICKDAIETKIARCLRDRFGKL